MKAYPHILKKIFFTFLAAVLGFCLLTGFTRIEKVRVLEGDIEQPYLKLGTLEVHEKVPTFTSSGLLHGTYELLTFGFGKTPTRGDKLKAKLKRQLQRKARDHYGADAVVQVRYWPSPDSQSFPQGTIHARGQMVRYDHFPGESENPHEEIKPTSPEIEAGETSNSDTPSA